MRLHLPSWLSRRRDRSHESFSRGVTRQLAESSAGEASYHPFTRSFDRVTSAVDLDTVLGPPSDEARREAEAAWSSFDLKVPTLREQARPARERLVSRVAETNPALPPHCTMSILIDLSGSMRGNGIQLAAAVLDTCTAALDDLGIATEILGFTTIGWKGGRSRRQWSKLGRPRNPGRLCDLLHIIFRDADGPGSFHLKQLFRTDLLHENVDGEAIQWALSRIRQRPEAHKVLLVVSDGVPSDDSTRVASGPTYLLDHLRDVLADTRQRADVAVAAIGICCDPAESYDQSVIVSDIAQLPTQTLELLGRLITRPL
jgi:cobaltochelatase CobT